MRTMLITDGSLSYDPEGLLEKLRLACEAGIDAIQLREKTVDKKKLCFFGMRLRQMTEKAGVILLINGEIDLALEIGADGVHLPEASLSEEIISQIPHHLTIGASVHSVEAAEKAKRADYLLYGAIFDSGPKKGRGVDSLRALSAKVQTPIYAVGGITPHTVPAILQAGATGIAAIRYFLQAADISQAIDLFKKAFQGQGDRT